MVKTTLKIDGMMCGHCEAHVNDAVRNAFNVKKVTSSHSSGTTEIISDDGLDIERLKETINATGYRVLSAREEPFERKGFSLFRKK